MRGSLTAGANVSVNGKPVGKARGTEPPGATTLIGKFHSDGNRINLKLANPIWWPAPGDRLGQVWERVFIARSTTSLLRRVSPADVTSYCGKPLDWAEIVRG
jgi:hypothetical protein